MIELVFRNYGAVLVYSILPVDENGNKVHVVDGEFSCRHKHAPSTGDKPIVGRIPRAHRHAIAAAHWNDDEAFKLLSELSGSKICTGRNMKRLLKSLKANS